MNQLLNPCFDGPHNGDPLDWGQTPGWDVSMYKNPCGPNKTAARLNDPTLAGESPPYTDEYLWQVVAGNGPVLAAELNATHHNRGEVGAYRVYGGLTASGPWELVWTPFTLSNFAAVRVWTTAYLQDAETTLAEPWPFYLVELHGNRGPANGGLKYTAAYFESK